MARRPSLSSSTFRTVVASQPRIRLTGSNARPPSPSGVRPHMTIPGILPSPSQFEENLKDLENEDEEETHSTEAKSRVLVASQGSLTTPV